MFDDQEFLDVTRHLQSADTREGFQRSAISRTYYSAFLLARAFCREREWVAQTGSGSDYRTVGSALAQLNETLASELRNLRLLRNEADYSVDEQDADETAGRVQHSIELAEFIRRELKRVA
jgi:uncharacterized protein (UPF0332 family)